MFKNKAANENITELIEESMYLIFTDRIEQQMYEELKSDVCSVTVYVIKDTLHINIENQYFGGFGVEIDGITNKIMFGIDSKMIVNKTLIKYKTYISNRAGKMVFK